MLILTKVKQGKLSKKFLLQNKRVAQLVSNFPLSTQPLCVHKIPVFYKVPYENKTTS